MRLRLLLSFVLIVAVTVAVVVVIMRQGSANEVQAFMFRGGMGNSAAISGGLAGRLETYYAQNQTWQGVESIFNTAGGHGAGRGQGNMGANSGVGGNQGVGGTQNFRLADAQGNLVYDSTLTQVSGKLTQSEIQSAVVLKNDGATIGYLLPANTAFTQADERLLLNGLSRAAWTAGLVGGGLALLLALLLAYRLLRPVRELTSAAGALANGDLSQRVNVHGDDELATLARAFNQMADSLQNVEQTRRAMTADIAHELRNPLAVQRANLEALQDGVYPLVPENLESILDQNQLLTRLVDDLRMLALAESGELKLERVPTSLPALIQRVLERYRSQADARQVSLGFSPPASFPDIIIDPGRVGQILSNLLSNSLRYTPVEGCIQVELALTGGGSLLRQAVISVHDTGSGIPAEALPHIFERFYRADRARSRSEGGTGLGLAIARQLAEAHGGHLEAANHPQGGALFTLTLPIS